MHPTSSKNSSLPELLRLIKLKKHLLHFSYNLALLFALPILFILTYVLKYFNPTIVIYEHLSVVTLVVFAIFSLKLLINHYAHDKKYALLMYSLLYSSFIFIIVIYYLVVLIGLHSWGRVITEEFIISYTEQAEYFLEALNISIYLATSLAIIFYAILFGACYIFLKKFHWIPPRTHSKRSWLIALLLLSLVLFFTYRFYDYLITGDKLSKEPITLTLFSGKSKPLEGHDARQGSAAEEKLNILEENARKNYKPSVLAKKRNLIVIIVDALRPDHMSVYGYPRDTTPNLRLLTETQATSKFTNLRSTCGETTCAHASYMASRYVHQLPDHLFTLQDVLKLNGYQTYMIISGDHINFNNIREVYGNVDHYYDGSMAKGYYFNDDAITTNKTKALPLWDGVPTMIHYHLLSAHIVGKKDPQFLRYTPAKNYLLLSNGKPEQQYTNFYDNGVLQADAVIKQLLDTLKEKKYLENSLVVITADHGEALGEHNIFMHTNSVIEEALHIPLLMLHYGYRSTLPKQLDGFMSLVDLAPTILSEFNINRPESWVGSPVQEHVKTAFSYFEMAPFKGLYDHRDDKVMWKYWRNIHTDEEFVYDLSKDPKEQHNMSFQVSSELKAEWRKLTATGKPD
ncbi:sulfatase-like hydrolase/transferase [Undibacterium sp. Ren11W]|uniref:sulfatase-like hydrolase/transferase n=1 Tax=Undibacterium sp. Ren11W TaxID=3413045 RepID=UPI003BF0DC11